MATEIVLPQWSMGMADGTIIQWLKREGEAVSEGEPLAEVEAAKVTAEVVAEVSGVVTRILVAEGETVPVRTPLCLIGSADEVVVNGEKQTTATFPAPVVAPSAPAAASSPPSVQITPVARRMAKEHNIDLDQVHGSGPGGRIVAEDVQRVIDEAARPVAPTQPAATVQVIPAARRLAKEHNIDLDQVRGSGPGGRITVEDVQRTIDMPRTTPAATETEQTIPLVGMRGTIARRMLQSVQTTAQVTLVSEVDVTALVELREQLKQQFALTYTDLIIKAVALALKAHPRLNARIEGDCIRLVQAIHVGMAVALDDGLMVPVVRDADRKALREIALETRRLATKAREGGLTPGEVMDGTFSVTNLGMYGIDAFTPIINPPEIAILGIGRIGERLVRVARGAEWRQVLTLSLTFDHRAVDGAPAAAFLQSVGRLLEDPAGL